MNKNKLGVIVSGIIWAIIMIAVFSSCAQLKEARIKRKCNKAIKYATEHGCLTFTDSVNIRDSVSIYLDSQVVVSSVDSILNIIVCDSLTDTLYLTKVKERIKTIVSQIPCEISPTIHANKDYSLKIWTKGGKLFYDLKIEPKPEKVCEELKWYQRYWWVWIVLTLGFCIAMINISNKISNIR